MAERAAWRRGLAALALAAGGLATVAGNAPSASAEKGPLADRFQLADRKKDQVEPRVAGRWVIWKDYRALSMREVDDSPNGQIYGWDLVTDEEFEVSRSRDAGHPAISGDRAVWTEGSGATTEIHGMDLVTRKNFTVTKSTGRQEHPAIDGLIVVWQDNRNGNWDIFYRDLDNDGDFALVDHTADQERPAISGNRVVWQDWRDRGPGPDIMGIDLETRERFRVTDNHDAFEPAISGKWVVWVGAADQAVFAKNLDSGRQRRLTSAPGPKSQPAIFGDIVVWTDERHGNRDVYAYDLSEGEEFVVVKTEGDQDDPHSDGATIVWADWRGPNRDIYVAQFEVPESPEPAPATLASPAGQSPGSPARATTASPPPAATLRQVVIIGTDGEGVKLRANPGLTGSVLKALPEGTIVTATGQTRQSDGLTWQSVRDPDGTDGWVAAEYVAPL